MFRFLFDTDHLTLFDLGQSQLRQKLAAQPVGTVGVCPVTIEEALRGRLASLARNPMGPALIQAYANLVTTVELFHQFPIVPFDATCEFHFQQLRASRLRVGTRDLKIAAVALAKGLTLVTRNRRDFGRIPGLNLDDWSV